MLEYVIWDWNGTLMDDSEASLKAMNNVLDRYGLERLSHQKYMEIFTFPVVDYYKLAGFDLSVLSFEELSVAYVEEYKKLSTGCLLSAGARGALEGLRARNRTNSAFRFRNGRADKAERGFGRKYIFQSYNRRG